MARRQPTQEGTLGVTGWGVIGQEEAIIGRAQVIPIGADMGVTMRGAEGVLTFWCEPLCFQSFFVSQSRVRV